MRMAKKYAFLSDPYVVGESTDPGPAHIPAEESLTQVISNDWVNAEYKHLIITASAKALAARRSVELQGAQPAPLGLTLSSAGASLKNIDISKGNHQ